MGGVCLSVCAEEGESRRRDVGLMRDTLAPLVVVVVVGDERVLLLLQKWRRRAAALDELSGQLTELIRVGQ